MNVTTKRISSVILILLTFLLCCGLSAAMLFITMIFAYAAWHCPNGNCETSVWVNSLLLALFLTAILIFPLAAFLSRKVAAAVTESVIVRTIILTLFAIFPVIFITAMIVYFAAFSR